jgi:hypothetical protein
MEDVEQRRKLCESLVISQAKVRFPGSKEGRVRGYNKKNGRVLVWDKDATQFEAGDVSDLEVLMGGEWTSAKRLRGTGAEGLGTIEIEEG